MRSRRLIWIGISAAVVAVLAALAGYAGVDDSKPNGRRRARDDGRRSLACPGADTALRLRRMPYHFRHPWRRRSGRRSARRHQKAGLCRRRGDELAGQYDPVDRQPAAFFAAHCHAATAASQRARRAMSRPISTHGESVRACVVGNARKRLDIGRNGDAVGLGKLRGVRHHAGHR